MRRALLGNVAIVASLVAGPAVAQADLTGRPLAAAMERVLKQPVILANKSGASGAVGMQSVAIARPDGYMIVITVPAVSTLPEVDHQRRSDDPGGERGPAMAKREGAAGGREAPSQ